LQRVAAKSREENVVKGLEVGSNDYLTKPVGKHELLARIMTQLRIQSVWRTELERDAHEVLLKKMLPWHVVSDLEKGSKTILTYKHEQVTILFSDIVSFTTLSATCQTSEVIAMLNEMFAEFDRLTEQFGVYKVETIGDAYMVASGHDGRVHHQESVIRFAQAIVEAAARVRTPMGTPVQIRVGIHSGGPCTVRYLHNRLRRSLCWVITSVTCDVMQGRHIRVWSG
jgi:class 3 adenylate cyclase